MLHESMTMDVRDFGAYCVVLDLIYQYGGAAPDDAHLISRYMRGCNAVGWKNIRNRLLASGHIYQDGDTLRSARADAELRAAARIRDANAIGGHIAQALQRKAKRLTHSPTASPAPSPGRSSTSDWSKLKTKSAENNDLVQVHSSYSHTQSQTEGREEQEERTAPPPSFGNAVVAEEERKGSGEGEEWRSKAVSHLLAEQIQGKWKQ